MLPEDAAMVMLFASYWLLHFLLQVDHGRHNKGHRLLFISSHA
jgi:hypothetical protein